MSPSVKVAEDSPTLLTVIVQSKGSPTVVVPPVSLAFTTAMSGGSPTTTVSEQVLFVRLESPVTPSGSTTHAPSAGGFRSVPASGGATLKVTVKKPPGSMVSDDSPPSPQLSVPDSIAQSKVPPLVAPAPRLTIGSP